MPGCAEVGRRTLGLLRPVGARSFQAPCKLVLESPLALRHAQRAVVTNMSASPSMPPFYHCPLLM